MLDKNPETILARLEGILHAFEWFNSKTNHCCSYAVHSIPKAADVPRALANFFNLSPSDFQVEPLHDFEPALREVFSRFLFLYREPPDGNKFGDYLLDPRRSFAMMDDWGCDLLLNEICEVLRSLGTTAAWRVVASLDCGELREWCFQDDVVVELPDRLCLLHFGVSD